MTADDVLRFTVEHRLSTVDALHRGPGTALSRKAVERHVTALQASGDLTGHTLYERKKYFLPSTDVCRRFGAPEKRARPMGPQALFVNYAILLYALAHGVRRSTKEAITQAAPHLHGYGLSADRYVMLSETDIALLTVDCGGSSRHLKRKLVREWEKRRKLPEWKLLQDAHQFVIVPIVAHEGKARRIRAMLRHTGVAVQPHVEEELQKLITPRLT